MTRAPLAEHRIETSPGLWLVCFLSILGLSLCLSLVLESPELSLPFLSAPAWQAAVKFLGGRIETTPDGQLLATTPAFSVLLISTLAIVAPWCLGCVLHRSLKKQQWSERMYQAGQLLWPFWLLPLVWCVLWLSTSIAGWTAGVQFLGGVVDLVVAISAGGILAICLFPQPTTEPSQRTIHLYLAAAMAAYVVTFTAMNWGLWFNLRLPHGDSAMYEEHLWNLLHGKGFRSYLDQGLFLGEHIQVIHLLLIPVYVLWPSQLCLELCGSLILASGAVPVYTMALRFSQNRKAALMLGLIYLLYFPMHYLDISIDLKTFRPNGFGIPLLLWTLDALERCAWKSMAGFAILTLSCQEDYAIPLGVVGFWLLVTAWLRPLNDPQRRLSLLVGVVLWLSSMAYLYFVLKVAFPYFRSGAEIHYVSYFERFGKSPSAIIFNIVTQPALVFRAVFTPTSVVYALQMLVPLAGLPLRSPSRLLVTVPLFVLLCLNDLAQQPPSPVHHFHAPLIPLLFWAAAAGLGNHLPETAGWRWTISGNVLNLEWLHCGVGMAVSCAALFSMCPLGLKFWDPGRSTYWRNLYVPSARAVAFAKIAPLIPTSARVASTDFVHPRFTHCERSYDYSQYPRRVANYEDRVPEDTDYIVIDTQHPYSAVRTVDQLRELQREPQKWELLPDKTGGYFIVLKRKPQR